MLNLPAYFWTNLTIAALYWAFNGLYFPLNWIQSRRRISRTIATHWDRQLPYIERFFYPYLASLGLIAGGPILFAWLLPTPQYILFIISLVVALAVCFAIWIFYPCKVVKTSQAKRRKHFFLVAATLQYGRNYGDYNSCPSAHVCLVTIMCLWLVLISPALAWLWLLIIVINFWSVLLTHQHYLLDAIVGLGLAGFSFYLSTMIRL